jgi:hypothetical protein
MPNRIKIKWKWIGLLCLAAPLLSFIVIKPDWLARLVAVNGVFLVLTVLVFNYGLNPRCRILGNYGYFSVHKVSEQKKKKMEFFWRIPIVLFGIGLVCFVIRPFIYDDIQFAHQGSTYAKNVEGRVAKNDTLYAAYFLFQSLLVKKDGQQMGNSYTAIFCNRIAYPRKTYRFTIAPKTGLILDFEEIPDTTNLTN